MGASWIARLLPLLLLGACGRHGYDGVIFDPDARATDARATDASPLLDGLIAHYLVRDAASPTTDALGGPSGVCDACPTADDGAWLFDGDGAAITVPDGGRFDVASFTVAVWASVRGPDRRTIAGQRIGPDHLNAWKLERRNDALTLETSPGSGLQTLTASEPFPLDTWHLVTFTWDGTTSTLHLDLAEVASATRALGHDGGDLLIGLDLDGVDDRKYFLDGWLRDLRIYEGVLDDTALAALHADR